MHLLTLAEPVDAGKNGIYPAGRVLAENSNAAAMLLMAPPGTATMTPWDYQEPPPEIKSILVIRPGAFGDLIQLTPALRALKKKYPDARLNVAVNPKFRDVLLGLPYIDGLVPYPIPVERLAEFDAVIPMEHALEHNPAAEDMTIVDAFALRLGVEVPESDSKADFILTPDEKAWAAKTYPRDKRRRVAVQAVASDACRTYHMERLKQLMTLLLRDEWEVMLMGEPGSIWIGPSDGLYNLTADSLTIRQSAAVLTTCDCAFGPDSMILHLAGALGVPALGVFAAFHWKHRITNHRSVEAIQGHGECSPCRFHAWGGRVWPAGQPCEKAGYCTVLAEIEPSRIAAKLARLVKPEIVI